MLHALTDYGLAVNLALNTSASKGKDLLDVMDLVFLSKNTKKNVTF